MAAKNLQKTCKKPPKNLDTGEVKHYTIFVGRGTPRPKPQPEQTEVTMSSKPADKPADKAVQFNRAVIRRAQRQCRAAARVYKSDTKAMGELKRMAEQFAGLTQFATKLLAAKPTSPEDWRKMNAACESYIAKFGELYSRWIEKYGEAAKAIIDDVSEYVKQYKIPGKASKSGKKLEAVDFEELDLSIPEF